jgi:hypothetical protein
MRRSVLGLGLCWSFFACDGREITVFEVPAKVPGVDAAGSGGNQGSAGGAGGVPVPVAGASPVLEAGSAGSVGGSPPSSSGGSPSDNGGEGGMSVGGTPSGKPCRTVRDCELGWRCEKPSCEAETGVCEQAPVIECSSAPDPVCGCDGVTYWNDCIRRLFVEAQVHSQGECRATACACELGADCGVPYASCSHLLGDGVCGHGMGACWVLPPMCKPAPPGSKKWRQCLGPDLPLGPCVDTCLAIGSQRSHVPAHRDDTCE